MASNKLVEYSVDENKIALVRMVDRDGMNVFSNQLIDELVHILDTLENEIEPKVMIIAGLPEVFSAGAQKEILMAIAAGEVHVKDLVVSERLVSAPFPIIAAIEGHAMGGGLVMAACCDIVVGALESRYGAVFMNMGFTPGMGCTLLLENLVGEYTAHEMMYTGKRYRGSELAKRSTHINYLIPREQVFGQAHDIALRISEKNVKSIYLLKYALNAPKRKKLIDARVQEDFMHRISFNYPETKKTIQDFYAQG